MLVPPGEADPAGLLDDVDGLLLTGGGDIDPSRWDGPQHETVYQTDLVRDDLELELARLAVARGFPTMCICRGLQVLNVALGGSLHVHVPDVVGDAVQHRVMPLGPIVKLRMWPSKYSPARTVNVPDTRFCAPTWYDAWN